MRICYFGAYDPDYPRNQILRAGLQANGATVLVCRVPTGWRAPQRWAGLLWQFARLRREFDVLLLAEFGQVLFPLANQLARWAGKPLVSDLLISMYDMVVNVRQQCTADSRQARRLFAMEARAVRGSRLGFADAPPHQTYFCQTFGVAAAQVPVLPLGVNTAHFQPLQVPRANDATVLVQYYGSYTPAHGVLTILQAANLLREQPQIQFEMLGKGQDYGQAVAFAQAQQLPNVRFTPPVPYSALPAAIARADIALGEFGDTPQTRQGIANKVYQTLAMGKALINGDTPSVGSLFRVGEHLLVSPLANAAALAEQIRGLAADATQRAQLGAAGQAWVRERYSPQPLGARLRQLLG